MKDENTEAKTASRGQETQLFWWKDQNLVIEPSWCKARGQVPGHGCAGRASFPCLRAQRPWVGLSARTSLHEQCQSVTESSSYQQTRNQSLSRCPWFTIGTKLTRNQNWLLVPEPSFTAFGEIAFQHLEVEMSKQFVPVKQCPLVIFPTGSDNPKIYLCSKETLSHPEPIHTPIHLRHKR